MSPDNELFGEGSFSVSVRTETYDGMDPVGVDPRWEAFAPFHDYILSAFPLVYVLSYRITSTN